MKKIGIDARFIGPEGTGLGKYCQKLIQNLAEIKSSNNYVIFLRKNNWDYLKLPKNFTKVLADVPWYSVDEQLKLPKIISSQNLDLLHVPHFNVPIMYSGKFIVTIHDLIHHQFSESSTTTRNPITFKIKRLSYKVVILNAVKRSQKIITPSLFVKKQIVKNFNIDSEKVAVTYEAAEEEYFRNQQPVTSNQLLKKLSIRIPFLIYVGNAYPHKNLENLLHAVKILVTSNRLPATSYHLVIACARDVFYHRLESQIKNLNLQKNVTLTGYIQPEELVSIFKEAEAYVFPTLSEGFGIPALNAMAAGLPVAASDIPTLKEVYADAALYFDPRDPEDIAKKIKQILQDNKLKSDLIKKGREQVKKYSWRQMAEETLKIYEEIL